MTSNWQLSMATIQSEKAAPFLLLFMQDLMATAPAAPLACPPHWPRSQLMDLSAPGRPLFAFALHQAERHK